MYQCVNLSHEWDARDSHMIRKRSLIIVAASRQINLNYSINFFPFFLFLSFSLGQVLQIQEPEQLLTRVLLYFIVLFPANFHVLCSFLC